MLFKLISAVERKESQTGFKLTSVRSKLGVFAQKKLLKVL